jgi:hypothetical protein
VYGVPVGRVRNSTLTGDLPIAASQTWSVLSIHALGLSRAHLHNSIENNFYLFTLLQKSATVLPSKRCAVEMQSYSLALS